MKPTRRTVRLSSSPGLPGTAWGAWLLRLRRGEHRAALRSFGPLVADLAAGLAPRAAPTR